MGVLSGRMVGAFMAGMILVPTVWGEVTLGPIPRVSAQLPEAGVPKGEYRSAERGRTIFNSTGICFYCHGIDAFSDRHPNLSRNTETIVQNLMPKPADLRKPSSLKLKNDAARLRLIREGHEGTGMFPDTRLTDDDIRDLLAYLSLLRESAGTGLETR